MKPSRKIRENVLFTWGYSRNKVKSRHFCKKRSCSPEAHPQDVTSGRTTKPEGLRCRVWRDPCCLRPELEETRPPEKHLCGAPLGTEGNPTESPQSKRGGQRPLQTGQEQTRAEEAPSPQTGLPSPTIEVKCVQLPLGPWDASEGCGGREPAGLDHNRAHHLPRLPQGGVPPTPCEEG